ncbi:MAG: response regulator [Lachnospiraceae bacterium]|nr:response regulator [Lachnospiraceae bacterium]
MKTNKKACRIFAAALSVLCIGSACLYINTESLAAENTTNAVTAASSDASGEEVGGGYAATGQIGNVGYTTMIYDALNGLPTSDANCIAALSDGYIWIGGYSGIIRYDGRNFERLDASNGLTSGRAIFEDSKGRVWIGTNDNGAVMLENGEPTRYTYEEGLPSSSVRAFAEDSAGNVYIGSTAGLSYVDDDMHLHQVDEDVLNNETVEQLSADADGKVYGCTYNGTVFTVKDGEMQISYTAEDIGIPRITTIYADPRYTEKVYLGTGTSAIYYGEFGNQKSAYKRIEVYPMDSVSRIVLACGRIWVNSDKMAGYLDENNTFRELTDNPLRTVEMITSDYQGNIWMASSRQGVMKVVTNNFRELTTRAGINTGTVNSTCMYKGLLYVGADNGLFALDSKYQQVKTKLTEELEGVRIRCLTADDNGNLWVATYDGVHGLINETESGKIRKYNVDDGMVDNKIRCITMASDGSAIVGTNGGLNIIKGGMVIRAVGASETLTNTVFLTVAEGENGTVYAGTDGDGIYAITGHKVQKIGREHGLTSDVILRITRDDKHGVHWIITSNSIEYLKDGHITNVTTFPYNNNFEIFCDSSDNLWILSSMGIYCMNAEEMLNNTVTDYRLYTVSNGLPGAPTGNGFSHLDKEGNLYVSERSGACVVNVEHYFEKDSKVRINLGSITCNDENILPDADGVFTIPAVMGRIVISPAILDYSMTDPLIHVYLEGTKDPGITSERSTLSSLEYTGLGYGDYTLHVQILDKTSKEIYQDETFRIVKKPAFGELMVVRVVIFLVLALFVAFIVWRVIAGTVVQKQYEEIRLAKDEAERANTAKSRFLANISHEIRTPINTIMGMDEMILREDARAVPKGYFLSMINYALDIRNASESLLSLINDLLDMSKIESGKMHLVEQSYDTQNMLRSIVSMIRGRSNEKGLTFDVVIDEILPKTLYGDFGKIKQVVINLLTNALKYTDVGGFCLNVTMEERVDKECTLRFSVVDTGIGVKPEDMDKLFNAYERLDEEKNSGFQGTGLGLDISRRFAELMGGTLVCESTYGEGSEFILTVTQKIEDATPIGAFVEHDDSTAKGPYVPKFIAPDADVLVVDDNPMNLTVIRNLLKATKVFVTTASSGEECLEKIKETKFNIVLLDHMMPGMDGVETVGRIRETDPDLPVYALTANAAAGEEFYKSKGFNGYLAKPVDSAVLERTIMQHLPEEMMEKPDSDFVVEELTELPENMLWVREEKSLDVDEGIKNSGGISSYIFSLNMFADTIDGNASVIEEAFKNENIRLFTIKVHALKSSARIIGAKALSEFAQKLEDAGNQEDKAFITANTEQFLADYMAYKEILAPLKPEEAGSDDGKEPIPEEELDEAYKTLLEMVPQMDYDAVEMILDQLKEYKLPEADTKIMKELAKLLKTFDWDQMEELIKNR